MQSAEIRCVFLFLLLCSVEGTLNECGEFNTQHVEFEDYFNANKLMENATDYKTNDDLIKYTVSISFEM